MTSVFHKILRAVAGAMEIPDVVFLVLALGFAVFSVGWLICEYFTEHRHMREDLPRLLDALRERGADTALLILLEREQSHYDHILKCTELVSKLAPMLGLLGTLIPLGPGIIALGQGDTQTLSTSLLTAFDTTIVGLCAAAVCLVVTTLRKRWYSGYMADLETLMDCVCEEEAA